MQYTESEQRAMLTKAWRQYGRFLLVAVILGLVIGYSWRYWQSRKADHAAAASDLFQQVMLQPLSKALAPSNTAVRAANLLITQHPKLEYANLARLWLAKNAVLGTQWTTAEHYLQQVVSDSANITLRQVARLRQARVLAQEKQYKKALSSLDTVDDTSYVPLIEVARGDIYMSQQQWAQAQQAYQAARSAFSQANLEDPLLARKLSAVAVRLVDAGQGKQARPSTQKVSAIPKVSATQKKHAQSQRKVDTNKASK